MTQPDVTDLGPDTSSAAVTTVYTDGACLRNPGPGGWAWAIPGAQFVAGCEASSTNQRMELRAVLEAVRAIPGPLHIVSDSRTVVNCFVDEWFIRWEDNGWKNSSRKPIDNQDLWRPLVATYESRGDISFEWVKGHAGDPHNDLVDRLALEAARSQTGRVGEGPLQSLPVDADPKTLPSRSFPAKFSGTCPTCGVWFPVGTPLVKNRLNKYVHAGGCPSK